MPKRGTDGRHGFESRQPRVNETETAKHRRAFEKNAESDKLEAMENGKEKGMGITETRSAEMDCP